MPGAILPNMGLTLPELGGDSGDWDDLLNDIFEEVDAHDHTAGKGVLVPVAGITIDADLPFAGFGPTGLGKAAFNAVTALASGTKTIFVSSADNELYWRNNSGVNVKMTSGSTLNISLVGGIAGDYTSVGAEVAYDDANDRYTFKQQGSPKPWARLASGDVRLYEYNTVETVYVGLKAPSGLASSFDVTFPLAAPGSTSLVQMDSSGVLSASNTVANAATFSSAVTFSTSLNTPTITGTPNFTGAVTMATTLGVTGLITATAGLTTPSNVTIDGSLFQSARTILLDLGNAIVPTGTLSSAISGGIVTYELSASGEVWVPVPHMIASLDRPTIVSVIFEDNTVPSVELWYYSLGGTNVFENFGTSGGGVTFVTEDVNTTWTRRKATITAPIKIPANGRGAIQIVNLNGGAGLKIIAIEITYDAVA